MKRILFVDDEPILLDGLRRMLLPHRARWETMFAGGGDAALRMLEACPCDVVVTDLRMPGMDGVQFLERVRDRFPGIVRIILVGPWREGFHPPGRYRCPPVCRKIVRLRQPPPIDRAHL